MRVRDVMTSTVVSINADTMINEALAVMQMNNVSFLSVTHERECIGVLSEEEIHTQMSKRGMDPTTATAGALLERQADRHEMDRTTIRRISENTMIGDALRTMVNSNLRYAAVYKDDSVMVGVVTQEDLEKPLLAETQY
jgi:CBS domain-containing protein